MNPIDTILNTPELLAALTALVALGAVLQHYLDWESYYRLHRLKLRFAPFVARTTPFFVVSHKGYRDDAEFQGTVDMPVRRVWQILVDAGGSPHLINSVKRRETPTGEVQYSQAHVVWVRPDSDGDGDAEQLEAYLFDNGDGTTDLYAHREGWVGNPEDHLYGGQIDGDPTGVVRDALSDTS